MLPRLAALLYVLAALSLGLAVPLALQPWGITPEDGAVPLSLPLGSRERLGVRAAFVSKWSEYHDVALSFPATTGDRAVDEAVDRAMAIPADSSRVPFDLQWQVLHGERVVGRGSGREGAKGAIRSPDGARTLVFGDFPAQAGWTYVVQVSFAPELERILRAAPALEVRMANTAKISWLRSYRVLAGITAVTSAILALGFLLTAVRLQRAGRRPS